MERIKISYISQITKTPASTIRFYEKMNFIEHAERLSNGYRIFNNRHILQIKLCRLVFREFINKNLRKASMQIIEAAAQWDIPRCRLNIDTYITLLEIEIQKAHNAFDIIKKWNILGNDTEPKPHYNLENAAKCIGTTKDTIRNWERNGLLNRQFLIYQKRLYGTDDIMRMKIIYMLLQTGYSIMAIYRYFTALEQNNQNALQILIDPQKEEDLLTCQDRWLQSLLTAKEHGLKMLAFVKEYEKK